MNDSPSSLAFREVKCCPQGHTACDDMSPWPLCQPVLSPSCSSISPARKQLHLETYHLVCLGAQPGSLIRFKDLDLRMSTDCSHLGSWGSPMPREDLVSEGYQKASSQARAVEQGLGEASRQVLERKQVLRPSPPRPSSAHPPDHLKPWTKETADCDSPRPTVGRGQLRSSSDFFYCSSGCGLFLGWVDHWDIHLPQ